MLCADSLVTRTSAGLAARLGRGHGCHVYDELISVGREDGNREPHGLTVAVERGPADFEYHNPAV